MVTREDAYCIVRSRPDVNVVRDLSKQKLTAEIVGKNEVAVYFEKISELDAVQAYCDQNGLALRV